MLSLAGVAVAMSGARAQRVRLSSPPPPRRLIARAMSGRLSRLPGRRVRRFVLVVAGLGRGHGVNLAEPAPEVDVAQVILDGKFMGTTPVRIPDVRIGSHVVRLRLEDHRDWTTSTRVTSGQESRVTGSLERIR